MDITDKLIEEVYTIMGEYDFAKLISIGCPLDEYESEAICLLEQMQEHPEWDLTKLSTEIAEIYKEYFGGFCETPKEDCMEIAERVLDLVNNK